MPRTPNATAIGRLVEFKEFHHFYPLVTRVSHHGQELLHPRQNVRPTAGLRPPAVSRQLVVTKGKIALKLYGTYFAFLS